LALDRHHHTSKKNQYTIVFVPDEDASKAKNFKFSFWQLAIGLAVFSVSAVALIVLALTYTPLGQMFPLSNKGLENKYNKELVSLNQKMTGLMEQLVELRTYNFKLRKAFGENVAASDSSGGTVTPRSSAIEKTEFHEEKQTAAVPIQVMEPEPQLRGVQQTKLESNVQQTISFPAILPTEGYMTRRFEPEYNHYGLDIAGKIGTLVVASADGNVVFSGWTYTDGYVVILSHSSGFMSFYKHNQALLKTAGTFVRRGEPIATLGSSGTTSSGPHLHFEIWKDGVPVNPTAYLINYNL
jgi:murein DD-endopeptidase MepM/ murein hydrolase activator NlpD